MQQTSNSNTVNIDEYDYTICTECNSSIELYCNTSITTITSIITSSNTHFESEHIKISISNILNTSKICLTPQKISRLIARAKKKLREIEALELKHKNGVQLHPNQIAKMDRKQEISQKLKDLNNAKLKKLIRQKAPITTTLLSYEYLNCEKCGLFCPIHPNDDEENVCCSKIFICSNANHPHKYCLCYHCGLLYGMNPILNDSSNDIVQILQSQFLKSEEKEEEILCTEEDEEQEVNEYDDEHTHFEDEGSHKNTSQQIDESYKNLIALKTKLNILSSVDVHSHIKTMSCPSSPSLKTNVVSNKSIKCSSLRTSPLLDARTPSPRALGRTLDESEKKWIAYLAQKNKEKKQQRNTTLTKLERQQKKLAELEKLQKELSAQKRNSEQFAELFRNGSYSKLSRFEI